MLLALALAPGTWLRSPPAHHDMLQKLALRTLPLAPHCCHLGPLRLEGAWQLASVNTLFGNYSALAQPLPGRLLAITDYGYYLSFAPPGAPPGPVDFGAVSHRMHHRLGYDDLESVAFDPASKRLWVVSETSNVILRLDSRLKTTGMAHSAAIRDWPRNRGAEAMQRLADGRFVLLGESFSGWLDPIHHPAALFATDPVDNPAGDRFTFAGPKGFRPTEMANLPDGRVLILMREVTWPLPIRFAIRLVLADPREIMPGGEWRGIDLGAIPEGVPIDNYEGMTVEPLEGGKLRVWMISDDNVSSFERSLLLAWTLDPRDLPPRAGEAKQQKGARGTARTPLPDNAARRRS